MLNTENCQRNVNSNYEPISKNCGYHYATLWISTTCNSTLRRDGQLWNAASSVFGETYFMQLEKNVAYCSEFFSEPILLFYQIGSRDHNQ